METCGNLGFNHFNGTSVLNLSCNGDFSHGLLTKKNNEINIKTCEVKIEIFDETMAPKEDLIIIYNDRIVASCLYKLCCCDQC